MKTSTTVAIGVLASVATLVGLGALATHYTKKKMIEVFSEYRNEFDDNLANVNLTLGSAGLNDLLFSQALVSLQNISRVIHRFHSKMSFKDIVETIGEAENEVKHFNTLMMFGNSTLRLTNFKEFAEARAAAQAK